MPNNWFVDAFPYIVTILLVIIVVLLFWIAVKAKEPASHKVVLLVGTAGFAALTEIFKEVLQRTPDRAGQVVWAATFTIIIVVSLCLYFLVSLSRPVLVPPPDPGPDEQLAAALANPQCLERLRALFLTCLDEYVRNKRSAQEIEKAYGLKSGTVAEVVKIGTFIRIGRRK